jgi:hypothetical protein
MDPKIDSTNKQMREKKKLLTTLERKNSVLRDKIFAEKENMKKLKNENILLNMLISKIE